MLKDGHCHTACMAQHVQGAVGGGGAGGKTHVSRSVEKNASNPSLSKDGGRD